MSGNNKDFKVKNGIQPTSYFEGVGTVVSSSEGYYFEGAVYDSVSFSVASQDTTPQGIFFKPDGTKMYILGSTNDSVYQYSLSTSFDLSTASYDSVSFSIASQDTIPTDIAFNNDGTKMYVAGNTNDSVYQYSLSTAWDLSTASYDSVSFSVASQSTSPQSVAFNNDGTKMYIVGDTNDRVYQYSLSTAWDLSTASYDSVIFSIASEDTIASGIAFNNDGTKMYVSGGTNDSVYQYSLSTAFDLSTASYDSVSFSAASQTDWLVGLAFNNDGTKMYLVGNSSDTVFQYSTAFNTASLDLSTGSVFEITPTSDIQVTLSNPADSGTVSGATLLLDGAAAVTYDISSASSTGVSFSVASQDTDPLGIAFNNSGTKMYIVGDTNDSVYQYTLSTAFDLSTASYDSVSFSIASQNTDPFDIAFNNDGTKMYIVGGTSGGIAIYQYSLSTAFDLSTASYDSVSFSVQPQDISPRGIAFNSDGTKMYIVGENTDSVYQYSLSTAFDLSTASYDSVSLSVASQEVRPHSVTFNNVGTKMYIFGIDTNLIYQYTLSTAFDLSTASYDNISFGPYLYTYGLTFNNVGTKMYLLKSSFLNRVDEYTIGSEATITYDTAIEWTSGTAPTSPAVGETDVITFNTRDGGITYSGVLAIDGAS